MEFDVRAIPIYWVNRLSVLTRKELTGRFKSRGYDVSPEEWAILLLLWEEDGRMPSTMADLTVRDRTTMTRLVDSMVKKDLVCRRIDDEDRRRSRVFLSPQGRALKKRLIPIAESLIRTCLDGLSQNDIKRSVRDLKKMTENLSKD